METDLKGLDARETEDWAVSQGYKPYQGRQIRQWLFKKYVSSFEEMTNIPKPLRSLLQKKESINHLQKIKVLTSYDGTRKYLFQLSDGHFIESVLIPEEDHSTLCISSQAGCAMGCLFCLTAKQGLKGNLKSSEIIDQVIQVRRSMDAPERLTNIVFMGMGEPLANYDAVVKAIKNLTSADGMNFSHKKVTISTCGLVPQIEKLGKDIKVNIAISLNATDDETRSYLMPINRKYPLKSLISVCRDFPLPNSRMITLEYILIKGVNDSRLDALKLMGLLRGLRAKVNLIPLNAHPNAEMSAPSMKTIIQFRETLANNNVTAMIRKSRGKDILAACGQLSASFSSADV